MWDRNFKPFQKDPKGKVIYVLCILSKLNEYTKETHYLLCIYTTCKHSLPLLGTGLVSMFCNINSLSNSTFKGGGGEGGEGGGMIFNSQTISLVCIHNFGKNRFKKSPKILPKFLKIAISINFGVPDNQISHNFVVPTTKIHSIYMSPTTKYHSISVSLTTDYKYTALLVRNTKMK